MAIRKLNLLQAPSEVYLGRGLLTFLHLFFLLDGFIFLDFLFFTYTICRKNCKTNAVITVRIEKKQQKTRQINGGLVQETKKGISTANQSDVSESFSFLLLSIYYHIQQILQTFAEFFRLRLYLPLQPVLNLLQLLFLFLFPLLDTVPQEIHLL